MTADPSPARVAADRGRTERRNADSWHPSATQPVETVPPVSAPTPDGQTGTQGREGLVERVLRLQAEPFTAPDVEKALRCHWQTRAQWGGETRDVCGCCTYSDGVPRLWPCPTRRYLTGEAAPDPRPTAERASS